MNNIIIFFSSNMIFSIFYINDYYNWLLFFFMCCFLIVCLFFISVFYSFTLLDLNFDKVSLYECGFDPFGFIRKKFDIRYYIVAILFIVFDLELLIILPWLVNQSNLSTINFLVIILFIVTLIVGFIYEWLNNALEWQ